MFQTVSACLAAGTTEKMVRLLPVIVMLISLSYCHSKIIDGKFAGRKKRSDSQSNVIGGKLPIRQKRGAIGEQILPIREARSLPDGPVAKDPVVPYLPLLIIGGQSAVREARSVYGILGGYSPYSRKKRGAIGVQVPEFGVSHIFGGRSPYYRKKRGILSGKNPFFNSRKKRSPTSPFVVDPELALPFMASLKIVKDKQPLPLCSATIIGKRHILTAAHCYYNLFGKNQKEADNLGQRKKYLKKLQVRIGDTNSGPGEYHEIDQIFLRPRVDYKKYDDIMVVQLKKPLVFDGTTKASIKLAKDAEIKPGREYVVAGFGNHTNDGQNFDVPDTYTFNEIILQKDDFCWGNIRNEREFCAGGENQGAMQGDGGGPLYNNKPKYQVGIIARGNTEHEERDDDTVLIDHGVYVEVGPYCDFIEKVTQQEVKCESVRGL
uniref:Peptidase S1 domain-containing protein n=1 Tax=Panagrellus redivivus TaxID=6233 RepID=A0A7E4ULA8_PANRE